MDILKHIDNHGDMYDDTGCSMGATSTSSPDSFPSDGWSTGDGEMVETRREHFQAGCMDAAAPAPPRNHSHAANPSCSASSFSSLDSFPSDLSSGGETVDAGTRNRPKKRAASSYIGVRARPWGRFAAEIL